MLRRWLNIPIIIWEYHWIPRAYLSNEINMAYIHIDVGFPGSQPGGLTCSGNLSTKDISHHTVFQHHSIVTVVTQKTTPFFWWFLVDDGHPWCFFGGGDNFDVHVAVLIFFCLSFFFPQVLWNIASKNISQMLNGLVYLPTFSPEKTTQFCR